MDQDQNFNPDVAQSIVNLARQLDYASIAAQKANPDAQERVIVLALDTAADLGNPYKVGFPFRSVRVQTATDANVSVYLVSDLASASTKENNGILLKLNDSYSYASAKPNCNICWDAQAGKTITLLFSVFGQFVSGSQVSNTAGGVSISTGTAVTTKARASVTTTAAALSAVPVDSTRKMALIRNLGGGNCYLGSSVVTTDAGGFPGIKLNVGDSYEWDSQAACYAVGDAALSLSISTFS